MQVNGNVIFLEEPQSLLDFLETQKYDVRLIAVQCNGEIIPRTTFKDVVLKDEDTLEIVSFVGGG